MSGDAKGPVMTGHGTVKNPEDKRVEQLIDEHLERAKEIAEVRTDG